MIRLLAPAKVNLTLRVLGRREDGYHEIESLVQKISLYDRITLSERGEPGIHLTCSDPSLPTGPDNLAYLAAQLIMEDSQTREKGISIHLDKAIPHGAGLGGGSSDAASVLMGLNTLWKLSRTREELAEFAQKIGSDVPLFLHPSPSLITGRGEKIEPSPILINATYVVVSPEFSVSTQWAYSNFRLTKEPDKYTLSGLHRTEKEALPPDQWQNLLINDLEEAVTTRHPEIGRCKEDLLRAGASASLMSGSGSTVFGLFEDRQTAEKAVAHLMEGGSRVAQIASPIFS
ncbi:MAG: 4-(cytidine 5'-diphospho)-2-C-methyl-D-erythritol kinase [bacterium]|nr:4-(cytidine 5'-diphospho)-2-C-methyl-D-erythritol kinase [bacterium]MDT8366035.1 4-(cytidine 5'-diphospho)-2-C-methyl-D-erythritol kinase [bacterium]